PCFAIVAAHCDRPVPSIKAMPEDSTLWPFLPQCTFTLIGPVVVLSFPSYKYAAWSLCLALPVVLFGAIPAQSQGWPTATHPDQVLLYPEEGEDQVLLYPETGEDQVLPYPEDAPTFHSPTSQSPIAPLPNSATPTVRSLQLIGGRVLTPAIAQAFYRSQIGQPVDGDRLERIAFAIDQWYLDNGYSLSQVSGWMTDADGVLTVEVVEPEVNQITFRYVDETGRAMDDNGEPIQGRTRESFLRREIQLETGTIFNQNDIIQDIQTLMSLNLFDNTTVAVEVDEESVADPVVDVTYVLQEKLSRSFQASGGVSTELGVFAGLNYQDGNFNGRGESLRFGTQVGSRGLVFSTAFTSPYRDSHPDRLGYEIRAFRSTVRSVTFSDEVTLANGDDARERRFGGGGSVMRPIGNWDAELGLNYARVSIRDDSGDLAPTDELGNDLTVGDGGIDDLLTLEFAVTQDERVNPSNPNDGSVLTLSTEQSIPVGNGSIVMNRLQANYAEYVPVNLFNTGRVQNPEVVAFNVQAGTVLGDLPPYEAFDLGGGNSVRGYGPGDVGSGRRFFLATAEYRFPVAGPLGAVLFTDFASDLGSASEVPGDPAGARDKPGTGLGYGAGLRIGSPLGLIRADFGFNNQGDNQFFFGFGQRF
ncbi:MAG: BamA/TamA family outer membrane protein, partial [Leptolyngbyaceae bacterium]|nr:BamA/TamA family outer membrane protein [Leptolyngbyaceae bacterium]